MYQAHKSTMWIDIHNEEMGLSFSPRLGFATLIETRLHGQL